MFPFVGTFVKEIPRKSLNRGFRWDSDFPFQIRADDLATGGSGVRAQAISPEGELVQDFSFIARPDALHVLKAPSPAAIGAEIADMAAKAAAG